MQHYSTGNKRDKPVSTEPLLRGALKPVGKAFVFALWRHGTLRVLVDFLVDKLVGEQGWRFLVFSQIPFFAQYVTPLKTDKQFDRMCFVSSPTPGACGRSLRKARARGRLRACCRSCRRGARRRDRRPGICGS